MARVALAVAVLPAQLEPVARVAQVAELVVAVLPAQLEPVARVAQVAELVVPAVAAAVVVLPAQLELVVRVAQVAELVVPAEALAVEVLPVQLEPVVRVAQVAQVAQVAELMVPHRLLVRKSTNGVARSSQSVGNFVAGRSEAPQAKSSVLSPMIAGRFFPQSARPRNSPLFHLVQEKQPPCRLQRSVAGLPDFVPFH
ncbi:MAG: hypothetical protein RLZZ488_956 [Pseudomonadota bacterium]